MTLVQQRRSYAKLSSVAPPDGCPGQARAWHYLYGGWRA